LAALKRVANFFYYTKQTRLTMAIVISKTLLQEKNLREVLRFAYYSDSAAFIKALAQAGIEWVAGDQESDEEQIDYLAYLGDSGADVGGKVRRPDSTPVHFSVWDTVGKVNINLDELQKSGIQLSV